LLALVKIVEDVSKHVPPSDPFAITEDILGRLS